MASLFNERQQGNFPSTSEVNPKRDGKEHCKAITLRSGKTGEKPVESSAKNDKANVEREEDNARNSGKSTRNTRKAEKLLENSKNKEQRKTELKAPSREDTPTIPYP